MEIEVCIDVYDAHAKIYTNHVGKQLISNYLAIESEGKYFSPLFKNGHWDGFVKFFDSRTNTIPAGLAQYLRALLEMKTKYTSFDFKVIIRDQRVRPQLKEYLESVTTDLLDGISLRPSQLTCINSVFNGELPGRGIINAYTGAGKSEVICALAKIITGRILIIAPDTYLASQLHERLTLRGVQSILYRGEDENMISDRVVVSNIQMLHSRLKKYRANKKAPFIYNNSKYTEYLASLSCVLLDEVQFSSSDSYRELFATMPNAFFRVGVSATPFKSANINDMNLMGVTGNILAKVTIIDLIREKAVSIPYYVFMEGCSYKKDKEMYLIYITKYNSIFDRLTSELEVLTLQEIPGSKPSKVLKSKQAELDEHVKSKKSKVDWHVVYEENVTLNHSRNSKIVELAKQFDDNNMKCLIFVTQVKHGVIINNMLTALDVKSKFIYGDDDIETRNEYKKHLEDNDLNILIATKVFDAGVDIKGGLNALILGGAGKSRIAVSQRTGRGARLQSDGFNKFLVVDFMDKGSYIEDHSKDRHEFLLFYKFEPVVTDNYEFINKFIDKRNMYLKESNNE